MTISQAASVNLWREAILDRLAVLCMDAPQDEPPASILRRIIAAEVEIALDPSVSDAVPRRTLLQMALDALDRAISDDRAYIRECKDAAEAIRAHLAAQPATAEDFCYCDDDISLQMVSGGAALEGLYGRVTLKINGQYVDYVKAQPAPAEPVSREHAIALRDAELCGCEDMYFAARPQIDTLQARRIYAAGFKAGYEVRPLAQPLRAEPVALESVHLTRDIKGMCTVRVNGRVAIQDNGDIIDHMATLEWFAAPPAAPADDHATPSGGQEAGPQEDRIEAAYWRFDVRHKGYSQWKTAPMSERDAFKAEMRNALEAEKVRAEMRLVARGWRRPDAPAAPDHLCDVAEKAAPTAPAPDGWVMVPRKELGDGISLLHQAMVGACDCLTKTHEAKYHAESCFYRRLSEQCDKLEATIAASPAAPAAPVPLTDTETHAELWKLAVHKGLITVRSELIDPRNHGTRVSWMQGHDKACDISNDAAAHGIAASPEVPK